MVCPGPWQGYKDGMSPRAMGIDGVVVLGLLYGTPLQLVLVLALLNGSSHFGPMPKWKVNYFMISGIYNFLPLPNAYQYRWVRMYMREEAHIL